MACRSRVARRSRTRAWRRFPGPSAPPRSRRGSSCWAGSPMADVVREGCLVLADISGYTNYLAGVELEHSHDILADLLGMVSAGLCPPLRMAKLEGDAVFCVTPEQEATDGRGLMASFESTYLAFARRR